MITSAVLAIEERAMNAWPALQTISVRGWNFRIAGGYTKRANSVNALAPCGNFEDVMEAAKCFYFKNHLPAIFRISPLAPSDCDMILEAGGYRLFDPSLVMISSIGDMQAPSAVDLESKASAEWLNGIAEANEVAFALRPIHDAIVHSIAMPTGFATLRHNDVPIGFGLAVRERGMVGLFDIVISPAFRGKAFGRAITQALLAWGRAGGAKAAYLQVRGSNSAAIGLYNSLGFREAYKYHYRIPEE